MPPNPGDNCKIKVAVRVRPFNRRGKFFLFLYKAKVLQISSGNNKNIDKKSNCDRVRGK